MRKLEHWPSAVPPKNGRRVEPRVGSYYPGVVVPGVQFQSDEGRDLAPLLLFQVTFVFGQHIVTWTLGPWVTCPLRGFVGCL